MSGYTIILAGSDQRTLAARVLNAAPPGSIVTIQPPKRTLSQNNLLWAMWTDLSTQRPENRIMSPPHWKEAVMAAVSIELVASGEDPLPSGFQSSKMNKKQAVSVVDWMHAYGAEHGVKFSAPIKER